MNEKKIPTFLSLVADPRPAPPLSDATKETLQREYPSLKEMPSLVLAARISQTICAQRRTPADVTVILCGAIDAIRQEYRVEGNISENFCRACGALTKWKVEALEGIGLIERCTICGKVLL
jgi:hypothetical protein